MKANKITCPYCGGNILSDIKGRDSVYCTYCGQKIFLDDEKIEVTINKNIRIEKNINKNIHTRHTDDADVIRAKTADRESKHSWVGWAVLIILYFIFMGILHYMAGEGDRIAEKAKADGLVSAGSYEELIDEDYKTVVAHFESAGFTNIEVIDLDDSGLAFWRNEKVKIISVGGDTSFGTDDWFSPDTKVVISYH